VIRAAAIIVALSAVPAVAEAMPPSKTAFYDVVADFAAGHCPAEARAFDETFPNFWDVFAYGDTQQHWYRGWPLSEERQQVTSFTLVTAHFTSEMVGYLTAVQQPASVNDAARAERHGRAGSSLAYARCLEPSGDVLAALAENEPEIAAQSQAMMEKLACKDWFAVSDAVLGLDLDKMSREEAMDAIQNVSAPVMAPCDKDGTL